MAPSKPRSKPRPTPPTRRPSAHESDRLATKRALAASLRTEKIIQSLTRRLAREMLHTNNRLQALAIVLGSHARALEAEHDVSRSLETPKS
jgi:hypothetical protein